MASKTHRVLRNTAIQGAGQIVTWILSWILLVLLPRQLGADGFGKLFFAISYATLCSTFINLGVNMFLVKEVAVQRPDPELPLAEITRRQAGLQALLGNVLALKLVLAVVVFLLQSALIFLLSQDPLTRQAVLIIGFGMCLGAVAQTMGGAFQGLEKMLAPNLVLIAEKGLVTGGCTVLLGMGQGLLAVCWVYTGAALVSFLLQVVLLRRITPFTLAWDWQLLRRVFVGGLPFLIWVIFSEFYLRIGVVMLKGLATDAVVGWYGAATRIYCTLLFVPTILTTAVFPAMMRMGGEAGATGDDAAFGRASERLMNLLLFVAIPISAGTIAVARPFVRMLYGSGSFEQAAPSLEVLGVSILLVCLDVVLGTVLIARGREKAWSRMAIAAAVFNPLVNLWTIPLATRLWDNGSIGAALATLLTEALMMAGALWLMPAGIFTRRNLVVGVKGLALGIAMVVLLRAWGSQNLALLIVAGAAFYVPLALWLGVLPREDIAHLWHALRKGR
jgi:O-antigen/teichoic acid export membrane protein